MNRNEIIIKLNELSILDNFIYIYRKFNDEKCKEITKNAKQFVLNKLNWDQVIKDTASTMNKYV